jgi:hypothetical protein
MLLALEAGMGKVDKKKHRSIRFEHLQRRASKEPFSEAASVYSVRSVNSPISFH